MGPRIMYGDKIFSQSIPHVFVLLSFVFVSGLCCAIVRGMFVGHFGDGPNLIGLI